MNNLSLKVDVNGLNGTFEVVEEPSSAPPTPPLASTSPINWPVLWGVIGGVILVGLIIFLLARRKTY